MIEEIYVPTKKKIIVVTFSISDLPSGYINIELLRELPIYVYGITTLLLATMKFKMIVNRPQVRKLMYIPDSIPTGGRCLKIFLN